MWLLLGLTAVGAVYLPVRPVVTWLPVGVISVSRLRHRRRGKGNAQDECKGDSHGEPPIAPRHKTVVKVSPYALPPAKQEGRGKNTQGINDMACFSHASRSAC